MASPFPFCSVNRECHVKENPGRKKKQTKRGDVKLWRTIALVLRYGEL